ncbi:MULTISPECIES: tRNA epoxyqueuosine(34) reductase QueG [unclassified Chelatococcus]|uniref:tRNA epoxyqueuosine(34) reductase QueG n=1 Tax=unclassified Chelatococcus TaxID=2638111 RepID=UPI0020BF4CC4|nr:MULTISPECIES: tRNA epoxyqueuosine(34) reductase QueG [unclassified Chelatococcus]
MAGLRRALIDRARQMGFDDVRITHPDAIPDAPERLAAWLEAGYAGSMTWMGETPDRRADPRALWSEVRSVIMLGMNYGPSGDPLASLALQNRATISVYARNRDYHDVIKGKLKQVAGFLASSGGADVKVFVDTAPVMEKPLAEAAGLGWQGKHSVLVSRSFGSWLFLGAIFTTAELPVDEPGSPLCGSCRRCLTICPTEAFPAPYQLDARRCISYLTIEHKGPIDRDLRPLMGNRVFGCDDCLAVCPWNKFAEAGREAKIVAGAEYEAPALADLAELDDKAFRLRFAGSPVKRTGRDRFLRNVLIAIGNSGDPNMAPVAQAKLEEDNPLVRGAAVWALSRLLPAEGFAALLPRYAAGEADESVIAEWHAGLEIESSHGIGSASCGLSTATPGEGQ